MSNTLDSMLQGVSWQEFEITDLFEVFTGAAIPKKYIKGGHVPRITATDELNGVAMFTDYIEHRNLRLSRNVISISFLGSVFYHENLVSLDMKIHAIRPKHIHLSRYVALFLVSTLRKMTSKYNYGNQLSTKTLKRQKVLLPITPKAEPDWNFMQEFMMEVEREVKPEIAFTPHAITDNRELDEVNWGEFTVGELFDIRSGSRLTKSDMIDGDIPFIGAADSNNGITGFVSNINDSLDCNVLGVNYNGSGVVENFYHPYEAIFSDDVKRLSLRDIEGNKYLYLFLKSAILQQKNKYMYAYKFNARRMVEQKILLPINSQGDPDGSFMEQYMKRIENEIYNQRLQQHAM